MLKALTLRQKIEETKIGCQRCDPLFPSLHLYGSSLKCMRRAMQQFCLSSINQMQKAVEITKVNSICLTSTSIKEFEAESSCCI